MPNCQCLWVQEFDVDKSQAWNRPIKMRFRRDVKWPNLYNLKRRNYIVCHLLTAHWKQTKPCHIYITQFFDAHHHTSSRITFIFQCYKLQTHDSSTIKICGLQITHLKIDDVITRSFGCSRLKSSDKFCKGCSIYYIFNFCLLLVFYLILFLLFIMCYWNVKCLYLFLSKVYKNTNTESNRPPPNLSNRRILALFIR